MKKRLSVFLILAIIFGCAAWPVPEKLSGSAALAQETVQDIAIDVLSYSAIDMPGAYATDDGALYTRASGWVEYEVTVPDDTLFAVKIRYRPG